MVGDIVREADEVFCHSRYAADMVLLDAGPSNTTPVGVLPFAHRPISTRSADKPFRLVATFGVVTAVKNLDLLLSAMVKLGQEDPTLRFAIVGPVSDDLRDNCLARVRSSQISDRFTITGWVDAPDYADWLARTSIAVQLRAATGGESSAAIADCFSAGVPTIVTDLGAQSELPNSCVEKVDRWITPEDLASTIRRLLDSPQRLATMRRAAQAYADARSFCKVAEELYERLVFGRDRGPLRLSE
jgi:glycosyltransferase involved in cell wall biosynthesis